MSATAAAPGLPMTTPVGFQPGDTVLLTLGRLPKGLDIARALQAAGARVIVAEPFRRHLCGASRDVAAVFVVTAPAIDRERYLSDLLAIVARERVRLIVPVSEETVHVAWLRERLPRHVRLYTMPPALVLELHDKRRFIDRCHALGLAAPETYAHDDSRALALAAQRDVVVKPILSCSGRGVRFAARGALLAAAPGHIVQARIQGAEMSSFSIVHEGAPLTTVVYRAVVLSGTVAVCFERVAEQHAILDWVQRFAKATHYSGFLSFDFIVDAAGEAHAIECNPRATSGLHFVEPADLAAAILYPSTERAVRHRRELRLQQMYPCLTETQKSFGDWPRWRHNLRCLFTARDVSWSWRDPWPFISMPLTSFKIIRLALQRGVTFGEVATLDVGWYGDERGLPVGESRA